MNSEMQQQQVFRLEAPIRGDILWRNNVGACLDATGRMIRYGLGNDSAKLNKVWKSSDLIGMRRVLIGPEHVGHTLGVFTAIEVKRPGWTGRTLTEHEQAQYAFHNSVREYGGIAGFASSLDQLKEVMKWDR